MAPKRKTIAECYAGWRGDRKKEDICGVGHVGQMVDQRESPKACNLRIRWYLSAIAGVPFDPEHPNLEPSQSSNRERLALQNEGRIRKDQSVESEETVEECFEGSRPHRHGSEPCVKLKPIKPGARVMAVGALRTVSSEIDPDLMKDAVIYPDSYEGANKESNDIINSKCCSKQELGEKAADDNTAIYKSLWSAFHDFTASTAIIKKGEPFLNSGILKGYIKIHQNISPPADVQIVTDVRDAQNECQAGGGSVFIGRFVSGRGVCVGFCELEVKGAKGQTLNFIGIVCSTKNGEFPLLVENWNFILSDCQKFSALRNLRVLGHCALDSTYSLVAGGRKGRG